MRNQNEIAIPQQGFDISFPLMGDESPKAVAERLVRLRTAYGIHTQVAMANAIGAEYAAYHHAEKHGLLSRKMGRKICARFPGVSVDWLERGGATYLPLGLAELLGELPSPSAGPSRTTKSPRR